MLFNPFSTPFFLCPRTIPQLLSANESSESVWSLTTATNPFVPPGERLLFDSVNIVRGSSAYSPSKTVVPFGYYVLPFFFFFVLRRASC